MPLVPTLPLHKDYLIYNMARRISYTIWSEVWKWRVVTLEINKSLVQSSRVMELGVMKSTINHPMAALV